MLGGDGDEGGGGGGILVVFCCRRVVRRVVCVRVATVGLTWLLLGGDGDFVVLFCCVASRLLFVVPFGGLVAAAAAAPFAVAGTGCSSLLDCFNKISRNAFAWLLVPHFRRAESTLARARLYKSTSVRVRFWEGITLTLLWVQFLVP